jgi:hypothetical protein
VAFALACPWEEVLAAFIDRRLHDEELVEVILHLSTCSRCREVIRQSIRSTKNMAELLDLPRKVDPGNNRSNG